MLSIHGVDLFEEKGCASLSSRQCFLRACGFMDHRAFADLAGPDAVLRGNFSCGGMSWPNAKNPSQDLCFPGDPRHPLAV